MSDAHTVERSAYQRTAQDMDARAVAEARAILAETEPQRRASHYDTYFGEGPTLAYRTWPTGARAALAESLRSFVGA